MAVDKKVSELTAFTGSVTLADLFLIVQSNVDYKLTAQQLIDFIQGSVTTGSVVTFNNTVPANSSGKNGDVVIRPANGAFYQRLAGVWQLQYTVPASTGGNTIIYGSGAPNNATGNNGDTYINTDPDAGTFYKKAAGAWGLVYTMASGPSGANGRSVLNGTVDPTTEGANGDFYINTSTLYIFGPKASGVWPAGVSLKGIGNTILNGTTPPSNVSDGVNGDFYINTAAKLMYGPKAGGVWPAGFSLVGAGSSFRLAYNYSVSDGRFVYNSTTMDLTFTLNSTDQSLFPYALSAPLSAILRQKISATIYKTKNSFDPIITDDGTKNISVKFEGVDSDLISNAQIVLS